MAAQDSECRLTAPLQPLTISVLEAQVQQNAAKHTKRVKETATSSPWGFTGKYSLTCDNRHEFEPELVGPYMSQFVFILGYEIHEPTNTAELFGHFKFPKLDLKGVLRLCPREEGKNTLSLDEFDAACRFRAGVQPCKDNMQWNTVATCASYRRR